MEVPPKIQSQAVRQIEVEVLPPDSHPGATQHFGNSVEPSPIHALSALTLVAVDSMWVVFDMAPPLWAVAIPLCFLAVFLPTYLIQRHLKGDTRAKAATFAMVLAVLAAVPTPISGTPVGLGLLAWSGLGKWMGKPVSK